ncbi:hypothetical protein FRX31_006505 [Thalictrum thalictroides]|uniref:Uncharacterized protein n=1 Tax=Thalictrum thalictroides TaxID=46969 RepID=A0A7J6X2D2_THATH|nr:hypothetical protein FRX31_006505 [Thalictrum thalictroides]
MLWEMLTGYLWEGHIQYARVSHFFLELQTAGVFEFLNHPEVEVMILLGCQNCRKYLLTLTKQTQNMKCPQCWNYLTEDVIINCSYRILEENVGHS